MDWKNQPKSFWQDKLSPSEYQIMREGGTERAFTGALLNNKETGEYTCGSCETPLFKSGTKYDSGSGWPSFYEPIKKELIEYIEDDSYGMRRIEVRCATCGAHLGHVFPDGPKPTGERYCINSASLKFDPEKK